MTPRALALMIAVGLTGCDTADPGIGLATAHNLAAHRAAAGAPGVPIEGGSAAGGTAAVRRYLNGTVRQPAYSTSEAPTVPGEPAPASPK